MKLIFLDFETFYDAKYYTLRKMTPAEYILDARFETICVTASVDNEQVAYIDGPDFGNWLSQFDPNDCIIVTYNALFDMCILAWRYAFVPARMIDALGMARYCLGHKLPRLGLANVAAHLGVGTKDTQALVNVSGLSRADIYAQPLVRDRFIQYACNDTVMLKAVFEKLAPLFPKTEFRVMDLVLRCAVEPKFVVDVKLLEDHLGETVRAKEALLMGATLLHGNGNAGVTKADVMSNEKFVKLLEACGVAVPNKVTPAGKRAPALAKTDDFMQDLLEHDDPTVQALACARLGIKSTLEESRALRLLAIAHLPWADHNGHPRMYSGGTMPIPLRYSAAHTRRLGGDWKINMQNMGRGSKLRMALKAPPGYEVIVADLGQIEARLTAWLCHAAFLMDAFRAGKDVYAMFAEAIFGYPVDRKVQIVEGFTGKQGVLGLGFGAAGPKFYSMVIRMARAAKMDIVALKKIFTPKIADNTVGAFRRLNSPICAVWRICEHLLEFEWRGLNGTAKLGPCEISEGTVTGPGGLQMFYDILPDEAVNRDKWYGYGGRKHKIYGSYFLENIIQFLARILLFNTALRLDDRGYRFVHSAHDELVFIVPTADVENAKKIIHEEMIRRPTWALDLPLTASVGSGPSYGDAK